MLLGCRLSDDQWQEINYVETLLNVASALMPVGPPTYMAEIAPGNEKYLASALYSLSRSATAGTRGFGVALRHVYSYFFLFFSLSCYS